jgi:hypothetical protein
MAVTNDGTALQYVPYQLRTEALCFAAVKQDSEALRYVPEALKTRELCLMAAKEDDWTTLL